MNRPLALFTATLLALPTVTHAGERSNADVEIDTTRRWARGALGSARNSNDRVQVLACYLSSYNNSNTNVGLCYAIDAAGQVGSCSFYDNPRFAAIVATLSSDSHLYFNWNESYQCTRITIMNASHFEPKQ